MVNWSRRLLAIVLSLFPFVSNSTFTSEVQWRHQGGGGYWGLAPPNQDFSPSKITDSKASYHLFTTHKRLKT